jgi:ABC-2 type transport system permease protein
MLAEFKHTLRRMRGQTIGWCIGIALYGLMMASLFDSITAVEGFEEVMAQYPPELMGFFGDIMAITTPKGYVDIYFFSYMPIIIGIFAVGAGANLLVGDEENGILDLVMAHPLSRTALLWGRLLGLAFAIVMILLVGWLSWVIPAGSTGLDLTWIEFLLPFVPLFAILLLFGTLALLLSMLMPSTRVASMLAGGILVGNFLLNGLANTNETLETVVKLLPLRYFQGGGAIDGIDWEWFAGLLAAAVLFALIAWWRFQGRDIRVGGEGGWSMPSLASLLGRKANTETR